VLFRISRPTITVQDNFRSLTMGSSALMFLTLTLPAVLSLQVKSNETFGLDNSLHGIPQKLAKLFALTASGKSTPDMVETELVETLSQQRVLPKEQKLKLAKVLMDMFPEDSVDWDEYLEWKQSPFAQSLLQADKSEGEAPRDPLLKLDEWDRYYDHWRSLGKHRPTMRGPNYDIEKGRKPKLEKNLRSSEEDIAKDNCIPDAALSCYTKDISYLPCRYFNTCMAMFGTFADKHNLYAKTAMGIPKALTSMADASKDWFSGIGFCHAANAMMAETFPTLLADFTSAKMDASRVPCSVAFQGNMHLYKMAKEKNWEAFGKELGEEIESWVKDPIAMANKRSLFTVGNLANTGVWAGEFKSDPVVALGKGGGVKNGGNKYEHYYPFLGKDGKR